MKKKPSRTYRPSMIELLERLSPEGRAKVKREADILVRRLMMKAIDGGKRR